MNAAPWVIERTFTHRHLLARQWQRQDFRRRALMIVALVVAVAWEARR